MSSSEAERMQISRQDFTRVWGQRDLNAIPDIYSPEFRGHGFPGNQTLTREQYRQTVGLFQTVFPDCRIRLEEMDADSEFVYASWEFRGTPLLSGGGPGAEERTVSFRGFGRHRHSEGKVVEVWIDTEWASVVRQLGRTYSRRVGGLLH